MNIDDHARHEAVLYTGQHDFISLSLVRKGIRDRLEAYSRIAVGESGQNVVDNILCPLREREGEEGKRNKSGSLVLVHSTLNEGDEICNNTGQLHCTAEQL